jgi:hypothetical protein
MFKKLQITCDEATTICDKNQYGEATFMEKLKLQIHFMKCPICPQYTKQNNLLTKVYKTKAKSEQTQTASLCMSDEEKEKLRREFEKFNAS